MRKVRVGLENKYISVVDQEVRMVVKTNDGICCQSCGNKGKPLLICDLSEVEYYSLAICQVCVKKAFDMYNEIS